MDCQLVDFAQNATKIHFPLKKKKKNISKTIIYQSNTGNKSEHITHLYNKITVGVLYSVQ